jgi:hypothetical protein
MDEQFEAELKAAFSESVASLPSAPVERVRAIAYHPRTHRVSTRVRLATGGGITALTGVVIPLVLIGGAPAAFAGWTAIPANAATARLRSADSSCGSQFGASPNPNSSSSWSEVASDVRGPYALSVYESADGDDEATCLTGPSITFISSTYVATRSASGHASFVGAMSVGSALKGNSGTGQAQSTSVGIKIVSAVGIDNAFVMHLVSQNSLASPYTVVEGRVALDVTDVGLALNDGTNVEATTANGWFVAWWPSDADVTAATITSSSGSTTEPVQEQPLPTPAPTPTSAPCQTNSSANSDSVSCGQSSGNSGTTGISNG